MNKTEQQLYRGYDSLLENRNWSLMFRENSRLGKWPYSLRNFSAVIQEKNAMRFLMYMQIHTSVLVPESSSAEILFCKN